MRAYLGQVKVMKVLYEIKMKNKQNFMKQLITVSICIMSVVAYINECH